MPRENPNPHIAPLAPAGEVKVNDGFVDVPKRTTTQGTPGPAWPTNTPCESPTVTGDEPYRGKRPAQP
jgi:formylglycine-generating enzyme required for sulfatase activity